MNRILLSETDQESAMRHAILCLQEGGLVIYPTETVYGVAADAGNPEAVARLLAYKNRPAGKAISVLVSDKKTASQYVELNTTAERLMDAFLPGPLTVVCASKGVVDPRLPSELGTLGIRISSHPVAMSLSQAYGKAVTATSANASGRGRAYSIDTVLEGLSERQRNLADLVLDAGVLPSNDPSTVIDTTREVQQLVRGGSLVGKVVDSYFSRSENDTISYAETLMGSYKSLLQDKAVVFVVDGDLGAGKTRFAKGVAHALGVTSNVNSPTFTLMKEYEGSDSVRLLHLDCWRMEEVEASDFGLDEYMKPGNVIVAEWAHELLPYFRSMSDKASMCHVVMGVQSETERNIQVVE